MLDAFEIENDDNLTPEHRRRRAWHSIAGLIMAVALWLMVFLLPPTDFDGVVTQAWIIFVLSIIPVVLCIKGYKDERGTSQVGLVVGGSLLLFNLIGLVAYYFTDTLA